MLNIEPKLVDRMLSCEDEFSGALGSLSFRIGKRQFFPPDMISNAEYP
jgi:hypothetical protein